MSHLERLAALRVQLKQDQLDGFVLPLTDEHLNEYVGGYAQQLRVRDGVRGLSRIAVVLADRAAIFTDGHYTLQVPAQFDGNLFSYQAVLETSPAEWLKVASWSWRCGR